MKRFISKVLSNKIVCLAMGIVAIALVSSGIVSYMADGDNANNAITIGGNRVGLIENFIPPEELYPGVEFTKDVRVSNVGVNDCYVRVLAVFTNGDMEKYCTVDWNEADYEYNEEDGYWYYKYPVSNGEATSSLFTTVSVSEDIPVLSVEEFDIIVYTESYQAEGYDNYISAWEDYRKNRPNQGG